MLKGLLFVIAVLLFIFTLKYLTAPFYIFPEPKPFSGEQFFNPYEGIDSLHWRKGNFQIQSQAWFGITDGRVNTNEGIDSVYSLLGYDAITISDYQKINRYGEERDSYIPVYEHGYGIYKNHHVMIGADRVVWKDYPLIHNLHHKQHMMNVLRPTSELVFIAHPKYAGGWIPDDLTWITNYDGIEVLNGFRESFKHWDAALSSGKNMRILANDDAHDIFNINELGRYATLMWSPSTNGDSMVSAMKQGKAIGVSIWRPWGESWEIKMEKHHNLPSLTKVDLTGDTLEVAVSKEASTFRFIGQGGVALDSAKNTKEARYVIQDKDTYVRTEIVFPNRTAFYLNPVIRYDGGDPWEHELARIDHVRTWVLRIVGFATLIFIILNIYYLRRRIRKRAKR
jgi:hypothetical protein